MNCQVCQELLTEYALGSLASEEQAAVRGHLTGGSDAAQLPCSDCQQELATLHEALAALPDTLEPIAPPEALKREVLSRLQTRSVVERGSVAFGSRATDEASTKSKWQRAIPVLAALLCFVFAGLLGVEAYRQSQKPGANGVGQMHARLAEAEQLFGASQVQPVALTPLEDDSDWHGQAYVDAPAGQLHLYAFNRTGERALPVVWLQSPEGGYQSLAVMQQPQTIDTDSQVWTAIVDLPANLAGQKLVISLEGQAGDAAPTGPLLLSADLEVFSGN